MKNILQWMEKINNKLVGANSTLSQDVQELKPLNLDSMDLDEKWKNRFRLIHEAGGPKSRRLHHLDASCRREVFFNGYAMIFGFFYYLKLGMIRRGLMLLLASVIACVFILLFLWIFISPNFMVGWFSLTVVFALLCNRDYYNYRINGVDEFSLE